jgi:hypothetical protein
VYFLILELLLKRHNILFPLNVSANAIGGGGATGGLSPSMAMQETVALVKIEIFDLMFSSCSASSKNSKSKLLAYLVELVISYPNATFEH